LDKLARLDGDRPDKVGLAGIDRDKRACGGDTAESQEVEGQQCLVQDLLREVMPSALADGC